MGIFSKFENRMEDTFEGAADKMSNAPISPVQIAKKAEKQMRRGKMVGAGKQYAPTLYTVLVNPDDDERLFGYYPTLAGETETYLSAKAAEEGLEMDGHPLVRFVVDDSLKHGKFDIIAEAVSSPIVEQLRDEEMERYGIGGKAAYELQMSGAQPAVSDDYEYDEYDELAHFEPEPGRKPPLPYVPEEELDRSIDYGEYTFNSEDFEDYRAKEEAAGRDVLDFGNVDSQPLDDYVSPYAPSQPFEPDADPYAPVPEPAIEPAYAYAPEPVAEQPSAVEEVVVHGRSISVPLVSQPVPEQQPAPAYQPEEPVYQPVETPYQPAEQLYQQPAYQQPVYQQQVYQAAPAYEQAYAPVAAPMPNSYQGQRAYELAYQQPVYQQPVYQQPVYQPEPHYQQPYYEQMPVQAAEPVAAYQPQQAAAPGTVVLPQGVGANPIVNTVPTTVQASHARLIDIAYRRAYDLAGTHIAIGRETSNDIVVQDINASRRHAELRLTAQGYWVITDLRSMNGTLVNGIPVASQALKSGDRLTIGKTEFEFTLR